MSGNPTANVCSKKLESPGQIGYLHPIQPGGTLEVMNLTEQIEAVVAEADFGAPSARKTGRHPSWPYVPVVLTEDTSGQHQAQVLAQAYATRPEAVAAAERHIFKLRRQVARHLADFRYRALREKYGLPREIPV